MQRQRARVQFNTTGPSRAKPSFKDECDINGIMARYEKTGLIEHANKHEGTYGDFTKAPSSYHEAVEQVRQAQEMFGALPAKVRQRFGNDPGTFLDYVENAEHRELVELGLANERPTDPQPPKAEDPPADPALEEPESS